MPKALQRRSHPRRPAEDATDPIRRPETTPVAQGRHERLAGSGQALTEVADLAHECPIVGAYATESFTKRENDRPNSADRPNIPCAHDMIAQMTDPAFPRLHRIRHSESEPQWGWALPSVFRLLADPESDAALPECPMVRTNADDAAFSTALGYWAALDHILRYQLGWTHPAQGLARWLDKEAKPVCPALALVRFVWLGDGHLDRYLAWRLDRCSTDDHLPAAWVRRFEHLIPEPSHSIGQPRGPWQLHLEEVGMHVLNPQHGAPPRDVRVFTSGAGSLLDEQQVLLFDDPEGLECGWYGFLMQGLAPKVQTVEVYAPRFGRCGVFRRSPLTGRWHTTSEEAHRWGVRDGSQGP